MKMKQSITKLTATAALAISTFSAVFAQTNLGSECGCPPVGSRATVLVSTLATNGGAGDGQLLANEGRREVRARRLVW